MQRVLVFTRTKHGADKVVEEPASRRHRRGGDPRQQERRAQRERALARVPSTAARSRRWSRPTSRRAASTSTASRHVINFELPERARELRPPHRPHGARRRGGHRALLLRRATSAPYLRDIEKLTRQNIPVAKLPDGINAALEAMGEPDEAPAARTPAVAPGAAARRQSGPSFGSPARRIGAAAAIAPDSSGTAALPHGHGQGHGRKGGPERFTGLDPASGLPAFLARVRTWPRQRRSYQRAEG